MKKILKRLVSVVLIAVLLNGTFSSCADALKRDYMIKGEFFSLVLSELNYYPINNTVEEMQEADNYDIEAQTIADWELLPEEDAFKDHLKPVTKETVLVVLVNSMFFVKEGDPSSIKDAKMCKYPQKVADAVATGIVTLDNGKYINANQKLTKEECMDLIEKSKSIEANSHFEDEGTFGYDFDGNAAVLSAEDILNDPYFEVGETYEEEVENTEVIDLNQTNFEKPSVSFLGVNTQTETTDTENNSKKRVCFPVTMSKDLYYRIIKQNKDNNNNNNIIVYDPNIYNPVQRINPKDTIKTEEGINKPFCGKIINVLDKLNEVVLTLEEIDDQTIMANTDIEKSHVNQDSMSKDQGEKLIGEKIGDGVLPGFDFDFGYNSEEEMFTISVSKELGESSKLTVSASIGKFEADLNNVKYLFKSNKSIDKDKTLAKVKFKTSQKATLETSAKFSPYNNGNGKALANLRNSRWKGDEAKGADVVKLCKINVPLGSTGINVDIVVYLRITFEGTMTIEFSKTSGFEIIKTKAGIKSSEIKDDLEKKIDLQCTFRLALGADICLNFTLVKNIMVYEIEAYAKVVIDGQVYNKSEKTFLYNGNVDTSRDGDKSDRIDLRLFEEFTSNEFGYYFHIEVYLGIDGCLPEKTAVGKYKNLLYKVLGDKAAGKLSFHIVFNDNKPIWERTIGEKLSDEKAEEQIKNNQSNQIQLENTKLHVFENGRDYDNIIAIPKHKDMLKVAEKVKVKVKDGDIVSVAIAESKDGIVLVIYGLNTGSTEFDVYYQDDKTAKKKFKQTVSVTVEKNATVS